MRVEVVAFHSNSNVQTSSGRPYIRAKGTRKYCRFRPFKQKLVREQLVNIGVSKEVVRDYLFQIEEENSETGSNEENEAEEKPVYLQVDDNWLSFGLQIINLTQLVLIIDTIRYQARGKCGSQVFSHSGEIASGYCSGDGGDSAPYLYIVPPAGTTGRQVNYYPQSANPFDNLTLFISGFPIVDRSGDPSKVLQNAFGTGGNTASTATASAGTGGRECQPNEIIVIPQYTVELTFIGYFMVPKGEGEQAGNFRKRISFITQQI